MTNPIGDRIIVKPIADKNETEFGLYIASKSDSVPKGKVVAIGPGRTTSKGVLIPIEVSVGDTIIFTDGAGIKTKINNEEVLFLREDSVLGILLED